MPIPDFQTLMLPVLKSAVDGEANIGEVTARLAADFNAFIPGAQAANVQ
jgi:restriction endonuclease Mrr